MRGRGGGMRDRMQRLQAEAAAKEAEREQKRKEREMAAKLAPAKKTRTRKYVTSEKARPRRAGSSWRREYRLKVTWLTGVVAIRPASAMKRDWW